MNRIHHILAALLICVGFLYAASGFIFDYLHPNQISSFPSYLYLLRVVPFAVIAVIVEIIFLILKKKR